MSGPVADLWPRGRPNDAIGTRFIYSKCVPIYIDVSLLLLVYTLVSNVVLHDGGL